MTSNRLRLLVGSSTNPSSLCDGLDLFNEGGEVVDDGEIGAIVASFLDVMTADIG